ncbi:lysoplasmalogenase [Robertkochia flava]|uniref:lysoplasmalogenase n=1 Tax=Robertkochia flava TaxID=3447986 RepID=UPI001CCC743D|nr:lysoplasmalogenase [Robertkochia marina]
METQSSNNQTRPVKEHKGNPWTAFLPVYGLVVILDIMVLSSEGLLSLREISKPLILGSLIAFFIWQYFPVKKRRERTFLLGLIFSFLGDGFLNYEGWFLPGLISFFMAHVCYILTFYCKKGSKNVWHPFFLPGILIWSGIVFRMIYEDLKELKPYVILYMAVLVFMALSMLTRKGKVSSRTYYTGLSGGIFFVLSDSVLAINKFAFTTFLAPQVIMFTYALAQLLLVRSFWTEQVSG